jgi:flavorubredoxin
MTTSVAEIAAGIYRISTYVPDLGPRGFTFNQFLLDAEEPLLYHTGMRALFPVVSAEVDRIVGLDRLRWIAFSHVEADECGAMNEFLAAAPRAQVAHGATGVMVSLNDLADRTPRALADGEVIDLGGRELRARRVRHVDTPHVPHNWEARVLYEEVTGTLFCGDLATQDGNGPAVTGDDLIEQALAAEDLFHQTSLAPAVPSTLRALAAIEPRTLAIMHGSSFRGDGGAQLRALADAYEATYPETRPVPAAATA